MMKTLFIKLWAAALPLAFGLISYSQHTSALAAEPSAVILMYHRFGEGALPSTNISIPQLEDHITALREGGHTVVPLDHVVAALRGERTLPDKAIAITVDDAYRSFLNQGWPRFKAAGFPVTLFVATEGVDAGYRDLLSWTEIRDLQAEGVTIGAHSHTHAHYVSLSNDEVQQDLRDMKASFESALGKVPDLYAFPYGEAGLADTAAVRDAGFTAAFGQHSGAAGPLNDPFYLPRFALNESFGNAGRFRLIINTLPLPVADISPPEPVLVDNPPAMSLTLAESLPNISDLTCFGPRGQSLAPAIDGGQVRLTPSEPFPAGRTRINCTLRSVVPESEGRWHWFGWQMIAGFKTEGAPVHSRFQ